MSESEPDWRIVKSRQELVKARRALSFAATRQEIAKAAQDVDSWQRRLADLERKPE